MTPITFAPAARLRPVLRWMITFVGFPLGGLAAMLLTGPVDSTATAAIGGLVTGTVLGGVQAWGLRLQRRAALGWIMATGGGLAFGLAAGATVIGFGTTVPQLAIQGAVCGACVGVGQLIVLGRKLGRMGGLWPIYLACAWALGWTVTAAIGVRVDESFTVFGSAGALVVAGLTYVLPATLRRAGFGRTERTSKGNAS